MTCYISYCIGQTTCDDYAFESNLHFMLLKLYNKYYYIKLYYKYILFV